MCHIEEVGGQPLFKVKVVEKGYEDLVLTGSTPKGELRLQEKFHLISAQKLLQELTDVFPERVCAAVWDQILEPVAQMRTSSGTLKLFPAYLKGEDLFGLTTSAVSRIIESVRAPQTLALCVLQVLKLQNHRSREGSVAEPESDLCFFMIL